MFGPITLSRYKAFDVSVSIVHDDVVIMIPYPNKEINTGIMGTVFSSTVGKNIIDINLIGHFYFYELGMIIYLIPRLSRNISSKIEGE